MFLTKNEVKTFFKSCKKKICLFGGGHIADKTIEYLISFNLKVANIVDNSKPIQGSKQNNILISSPINLKKKLKNNFIIITTTSFNDVSDQLKKYGLKEYKDYIVSPVLNDLEIVQKLETYEGKFIFSSGSPKNIDPNYGGGIYLLNIKGDKFKCEKKISGHTYGFIEYRKNKYVAVDSNLGIFEFDKNFKILRKKKLNKDFRAHGIAYYKKNKSFFIVCSYADKIIQLDEDLNFIDEISLSSKFSQNGKPSHHMNDCYIVGDSLFVSMFSVSGNWKLDVFDGGIVEIDLNNKKKINIINNNLWMPHSITLIDNSLTVLESLRGKLLSNNFQTIGQFPGFTRGIDNDENFLFIGQSRNRNHSKNFGLNMNIAIDTGIIIFDQKTKASRLIQLNNKISEIHCLKKLI